MRCELVLSCYVGGMLLWRDAAKERAAGFEWTRKWKVRLSSDWKIRDSREVHAVQISQVTGGSQDKRVALCNSRQ